MDSSDALMEAADSFYDEFRGLLSNAGVNAPDYADYLCTLTLSHPARATAAAARRSCV